MSKIQFWVFIGVTCFLTACGGGGNSSDEGQPTNGTSSPTPVITNSATPTVTATPTITSTPTVTVSPTPIPTITVTPTPTPNSGAGIYDVDYGQFNGVYAFLDDGRFYGIHFVFGGTLAGHPRGQLSDSNAVDQRDSIAWANFIDDGQMLGEQEPNPSFGRTFTGESEVSVSIQGSFGTFSTTGDGQRTWSNGASERLYEDPIALNDLAGIYGGVLRTVGISEPMQSISSFSLDAAGNFEVSVNNCAYTGVIVSYASSGIYDATATVSGSECSMSTTLTGALMPLSYENDAAEFTLMLNSSDEEDTAVFLLDTSD